MMFYFFSHFFFTNTKFWLYKKRPTKLLGIRYKFYKNLEFKLVKHTVIPKVITTFEHSKNQNP